MEIKNKIPIKILFVCLALFINLGVACNNVPMAQPNSTQTVIVAEPTPPPPTATKTINLEPTLPTIISIAAEDIVVTDKLAEGLKFVYVETDSDGGVSRYWMSNANELQKRKLLVEVVHKEGFGSGGKISPDGNKLVYRFSPANISSGDAYRGHNEIWLLDINTGKTQKLLELINEYTKWTPDSKTLVYTNNSYDDKGTVETNIYTLSIVDKTQKLIMSLNSFDFNPMVLLDNETLLYKGERANSSTELRTLNLVTGETTLLHTVNAVTPWQTYRLANDKSILLITTLDTKSEIKQYEVITVNLITGEQQTLITYPLAENTSENRRTQFNASLFNAETILLYFPKQATQAAYLGLLDMNTKTPIKPFLENIPILQKETEMTASNSYLIVGNKSIDDKWLTIFQAPKTSKNTYLLEIATKTLSQVPLAHNADWVYTVGWTY